ncbi:MAG: cation diffusion facilitator family transporter [Candidatus Dasytiphilus stammeri]
MFSQYSRLVKQALLVSISLVILIFFIKFWAWWKTESVSLMASLVDSLIDIAASVTNVLIVRYSLQPADKEHTFGHGKAEALAVLVQSMLISASALLFLVLTVIHHLSHPIGVYNPGFGIIITFFIIILTGGVVLFQKGVVQKTRSIAIRADMLHYKSDLLVSLAIIIALSLSYYKVLKQADVFFALGIGLLILYRSLHLGYEGIQALLDRALPPHEIDKIIHLVTSLPNVNGIHKLRTRKSGAIRFIQLHLELDDKLTLIKVHLITKTIEERLFNYFPHSDIIIRQDPCSIVAAEKKSASYL